MCPLGFCKIGKILFHLMYSRKQLINWDLSYTSLKFELFDRKDVYGYKDDIERFVFSNSYFRLDNGRDEMPDVINCHDHHRFDSIYDVVLR
jgi:starch synthase